MFKERIRQLRKENQLTQKGLAEEAGLSWRAVQDLEAMKKPSYDTLLKISNYFGVSVDWLMGRTEDRRLHQLGEKL